MKKNLTILIPAYNEENTISSILEKVCKLEFVYQVIVVNDFSSDRTLELATSFKEKFDFVEVYSHKKNSGKTEAIKTGLNYVKGELLLIQDADLEYDPNEIIHLCEPIWENKADVVYGSRFLIRKASRVLYFYHFIANKALTFVSNLLTNKNMTDIETCYKLFRAPLLTKMPITSSGFGFEVEVTANISKTNVRIYETPISYYGRTYEEGKKIHVSDGIAAIFYILKYNIFPSKEVKTYIATISKEYGLSNR